MAALSQTPASVLRSSNGVLGTGIAAAGVTIVAGNMVSLDSATNTYKLADANVSAVKVPAGMALGGAGPGQPFFFVSGDSALTPGCTMTVAAVIYLSPTAGSITETVADVTTGEWLVPIGQAITATTMRLSITGDAVAKP